jgi:translation initiation factor 3 subunit D
MYLIILDFNFVNENAADPPVESVEKDTNINSHDALAREATLLNQTYPAHILKSDEKIVFKNQNPYIESPEQMIPAAVSSGAERYRKWEMDDVNLVLRTRVHACMQTKNLVPAPIPDVDMESCGDDLNETGLVNIYALNEFDHRAPGSGGSFEWRKKLDSQRGAVIATEMKNNAVKLARWTIESLLSGVDYMRLGFLSRTSSRSRNRHQVLGSSLVKPNDFVKQIAFNLGNGWGIVKALIDECFKLDDGMYILLRDPVKPALILYQVSTAPLKEKVVVE